MAASITNRISKSKNNNSLLDAFNVNKAVENAMDSAIQSMQTDRAEENKQTSTNTEPEVKGNINEDLHNEEKAALKQVAGAEQKIHEELAIRQRGTDVAEKIPTMEHVAPVDNTDITDDDIQAALSKLSAKDLKALHMVQQASADENTFTRVSDALARELNNRLDAQTDATLQPFLATKGVSERTIEQFAEDNEVKVEVLQALSNVEAVKKLSPEDLKQLTGALTNTIMMYDQQSVSFMQQCVPKSVIACRDCGFRNHCPKSLTKYERIRTSYYIGEDVALAVRMLFEQDPNYAGMTFTGLINTLLYKLAEQYIPAARAALDAEYAKKHKATKMSAKRMADFYNAINDDMYN